MVSKTFFMIKSAIAVKRCGGLMEKLFKILSGFLPLFRIEAVIDVQPANFPFDEPALFEFLQMLADGRAAQRQFFGNIARNALLFFCQ